MQEKWLQTNRCLYKMSNAAIRVLHSWIWCSNFLKHYNMLFDFGRFCYGWLFKIITWDDLFSRPYWLYYYGLFCLYFSFRENEPGWNTALFAVLSGRHLLLALQGRNGSDMIILKVFMRHKNINSTAIYVHLSWGLFLLFQAPAWKDKRDAGWITE